MMNNEKIIIIGGGVGPQAGTVLHNYIIENTLTDGTDQDHIDVYHFSRASDIPDRTSAIEQGKIKEPALGMYRTFQIAAAAIDFSGRTAVGGIPCNTFHAPEIFGQFLHYMKDPDPKIQIVNMIDETVKNILNSNSNTRKVGLLSTTGTRNTGVYANRFENKGIELIQVPMEVQTELHDSIYNKEWGVKAMTPVSNRAKENFEQYADYLINRGAEIIILGCTEIPLALPKKAHRNTALIDPMVSLARALIREANVRKLKADI